jgi:hypothetical protein
VLGTFLEGPLRAIQAPGGHPANLIWLQFVPSPYNDRSLTELIHPMATCLFTDELLDSETRIEHTIPRALGGRLKTREVSSNTFNEHCGGYVDDFLRRVYAVLLNRLGPILPSDNCPANLRVSLPGEKGNFILEPGAVLSRVGVDVLERENGKPKVFIGPDVEKVEQLAEQIGHKGYTMSTVPAGNSTHSALRVPVVGAEIELAALKCSLLTFDHLLRDHPNRFTRSESLDKTRAFVRDAIANRVIDGESFNKISLGLQYEKLPDYARLRHYMDMDRVTQFEHVLFAAGSIPNRCIDIVWVVFGFDPFGFRVSHDYHGPAFCYGFVNPIHKGYLCSPLRELPTLDYLLCRPTNRRTFPDALLTENECEEIVADISSKRLHADCQAVLLIENTCDDFLISMLKVAGSLSETPPLMRVLLLNRLRMLYGRQGNSAKLVGETAQCFENALRVLPTDVRNQSIEDANNANSWSQWLDLYRYSLKATVAQFGLPGDGFVNDSRRTTYRTDEHQLGKSHNNPGSKARTRSTQ